MRDDREIRYLGDLQRLAMNPGDVLVLSVPGRITGEMADRPREMVGGYVPGHEVLVLADGITVAALSAPKPEGVPPAAETVGLV